MGQIACMALLAVGDMPAVAVGNILKGATVILIGICVSQYATKVLRAALGTSSVGEVTIVVNVVRAIIAFTVAYFIAENFFNVQLDGIARALGITTLVVSLGLQDLIKNVVSGIEIVASRLLSVGDHIEIGDARGEVVDVNWRQTTMRDKDNNYHVIPNSALMSGTYVHLRGKMARRYVFECDIKPGLDLPRVAGDIECLADEALDDCGWRSKEHTEVRFIGSTANGVRTSIRIFLKDIEYTTRSMDVVMRAIGQRGYLADWTNENPVQEQWR